MSDKDSTTPADDLQQYALIEKFIRQAKKENRDDLVPYLETLKEDIELQVVWIDPDSAQENPLQWRTHDDYQLDALESLIYGSNGKEGVGWSGVVLVNDRKVENGWGADEAIPTYVDGHGRREVAERYPGEKIPAIIRQLTPQEEKQLLTMLDPISAMAGTNLDILSDLVSQLKLEHDPLRLMVEELSQAHGIDFDPPDPDALLEEYGEPEDEDFWPVIRVAVPPETFQLFAEVLDMLPKHLSEAAKFHQMLSIAHDYVNLNRRRTDEQLQPEEQPGVEEGATAVVG